MLKTLLLEPTKRIMWQSGILNGVICNGYRKGFSPYVGSIMLPHSRKKAYPQCHFLYLTGGTL